MAEEVNPEVYIRPWMFRDFFPIHELWRGFSSDGAGGSEIRIFFGCGLEHFFRLFPYFRNSHYFFLSIPCMTTVWNFRGLKKFIEVNNPSFDRKNAIILANNQEQQEQALSLGFSAIFCNQNCWLDESLFRITNTSEEREYDLVMNCRPERIKRLELAGKVERLAFIKGLIIRPDQVVDLSALKPCYMNDRRLSSEEVCAVSNQALCGGIFSAEEGACYVSSEYLLCGLPVISTPSRGGRDVWYDGSNSIICEPTQDSVRDCFHTLRRRLLAGEIDRQEIRKGHLRKANDFRNNFIEAIQGIFDRHAIRKEARWLFQEAFFHKMSRSNSLEDCVKMLS